MVILKKKSTDDKKACKTTQHARSFKRKLSLSLWGVLKIGYLKLQVL